MVNKTNIVLDPAEYSDGVKVFMKVFDLTRGDQRLELLEKLVEAFTHFPYENISKIIKLSDHLQDEDQIRLPEEVVEDHLQEGLGGTCFSLTFTLQAILAQNGFSCYPVMAHMRAGRNIHCALVGLVGGSKYLIDPGYLLGKPVALDPRQPVSFRNEFSQVELLFQPEDGVYHLYTFSGQERKWRYCFADRLTAADEFLKYWQDSLHKNGMHGISLNRVTSRGLVYVRKKFMREITPEGKRNVNIKRNYHAAIQETFGIRRELVEQALAAIEINMAWERERGFYLPRGKMYETVGS
jgi:arylamine N-acetyltransferase